MVGAHIILFSDWAILFVICVRIWTQAHIPKMEQQVHGNGRLYIIRMIISFSKSSPPADAAGRLGLAWLIIRPSVHWTYS